MKLLSVLILFVAFAICPKLFAAISCKSSACLFSDSRIQEIDPLKKLEAQQISSMLLLDDIRPDSGSLLDLQKATHFGSIDFESDYTTDPTHALNQTSALLENLFHRGLLSFNKSKVVDQIFISSKPKK